MARLSQLSRRGFLLGGAAAVASAAAAKPAAALVSLEDCTWCTPSDAAWRALAHATGGRLLRPGDSGFAERALPQNLRYRRIQPQAIAPCASPEAVAAVIGWCRGLDMPFAIRGGGHSYAGHSTTTGVMIDTSAMKAVVYDEGTGRVMIEAGALNADVEAGLRKAGRTITHGRCPSVGIAGFLLGGGIGFNMRRFGIGSDRLASTSIVLADGEIRTATAGRDPQLFWALRGGGGGNFGVSTSFEVETFPADASMTVFSMRWNNGLERVLERLVPALEGAPGALGSRFALKVSGEGPAGQGGYAVYLDLLGQFAGSRDNLLTVLGPALTALPPDRSTIEERSYWDAQDFLSDPGEHGFYQERSGFIRSRLSQETLSLALSRLRRWPGTGVGADIRFFQTGEAVNALAPDATAFVHRDSAWLFSIGLNWSAADQTDPGVMRRAHDWQDEFYAVMRDIHGIGAYQNFPDSSLADWRRAYYGANLSRLESVKAAVDPTDLFTHAQSL
jgi:FAD/FMN-containing dehydrogenase